MPASNPTTSKFLDENQYTKNGILRYEKIFGQGFVSTGGKQSTIDVMKRLNLKPNDYILDIGCGIGGSAIHAISNYGAKVHGVDLSSNMLEIGRERAQQLLSPNDRNKVAFDLVDATQQNYAENTYDVIYSRDALLHIHDKEQLFQKLYKWLKPGGKLLITDYCRGLKSSKEFEDYVEQRNYHLVHVKTYGELLAKAGFKDVKAEDQSDRFVEILKTELNHFAAQKSSFVEEFSSDDYEHLVDGWKIKIDRCAQQTQAWGLFTATKH